MAEHQTLSGAGEPTVRDHRDRAAQALADDRRGDLQHLAHPGPALGSFVADDHRIARLDPPRVDRGERVLLPVENTRGSTMRGCRVLRDLGHRPVRREVALQDDQPALRPQWFRKRSHHLLARGLGHVLALLAQRPARDRQRIPIDEAAVKQAPRQERDAPGSVQLDRSESATRLQVAQQRCAAADPVDVVDRELDADLSRERQQVQHRVGRTAARCHCRDRVVKGAAREDLRRP